MNQKRRGPIYVEQDSNLPPCIICDLDGTLALMNGRGPFDTAKCEKDILNESVANLIKTFYENGSTILLFTGRMDNFKRPTKRWLIKHDIPYNQLIMRKRGDLRKDAIVKKEMVDLYVKDKYFVQFVLDDRNQVVDMWRNELGYPCFQVFYGDF